MRRIRSKSSWLTAAAAAVVMALLCGMTLLSDSSAASASSSSKSTQQQQQQQQQQTHLVYWEEELPEPIKSNKKHVDEKQQLSPRRLFWHGRIGQDEDPSNKVLHSLAKSPPKPHPMRTNTWQLDLKISPKRACRLGINTTMVLDFAENGYCRQVDSPLLIGKWTLHPSGITWHIPLPTTTTTTTADDDDALVRLLVCHADLILNPFGKRPRMIRGTMVVKDGGRKWFRPVVATFTGEGQDTANES